MTLDPHGKLHQTGTVMEKILVTGAAGFIGFHVARRLLSAGYEVTGLDNVNDYYDPALKNARLKVLFENKSFSFARTELSDREEIAKIFSAGKFDYVINLAAQAGVRYSLDNPYKYLDSNLVGFLNIIEGCRHSGCKHLIYASSSSVYGANTKLPFSTSDSVDHPISLYAATKKANELIAHTYAHLFGLPCTGLRFFTVYGPWGRPDMAMWLFAKSIMSGEPIRIFNNGDMQRDFTYVDDIVEAIVRLVPKPPQGNPDWSGDAPDPATSRAPWRVFNIGNSSPVQLMYVIELIEKAMGRPAIKQFLPLQPGDVPSTFADVADLEREVDFRPHTSIEDGVERFVHWFKQYHSIN